MTAKRSVIFATPVRTAIGALAAVLGNCRRRISAVAIRPVIRPHITATTDLQTANQRGSDTCLEHPSKTRTAKWRF